MKKKLFCFLSIILIGCGGEPFEAETATVGLDSGPDVEQDAGVDAVDNDVVTEDVTPDTKTDVEPDVVEDVMPDIMPDVEIDVVEDVAPDAEPDATEDVIDTNPCVDIMNNPSHCGECNRECSTGECANGACMYEELVVGMMNPRDVVIDGNLVYHSDSHGLYSWDSISKTSETIYNGYVMSIAISGANLYLLVHENAPPSTTSDIIKINKASHTSSIIVSSLPRGHYISVSGNDLFISFFEEGVRHYDIDGNLIKIITTNGGSRIIDSDSTEAHWANFDEGKIYTYKKQTDDLSFDSVGGNPYCVAKNSNYMFWSTNGTLKRMNTNGVVNDFYSNEAWMIKIYEQKVYWTNFHIGDLYSGNTDGTNIRKIAFTASSSHALDVNDSFVYYNDYDTGKLMRVTR